VRRRQGRLREELGLSPEQRARGRLLEPALAAGFHRAGFVDPGRLPGAARHVPPDAAGLDWEWITAADGWRRSASILVCCLSCFRREPDDPSLPGNPHALIAPFARAHYYRHAVKMLQEVADRFSRETGVPRASVRLFSNSRLPEKPLLAATGLGAFGRNGCLIVPGLGSLFVIAGAVVPVATPDRPAAELSPAGQAPDPCGSCRRCRAACPARAIDDPYIVRRDRCLQALAATLAPLAEATMGSWGSRLYGCQECQAVCPHNGALQELAPPAVGELGPGIAIRDLLLEDDAARRKRFRGTALGMSWVPPDALLRNALVAAGNRRDPALREAVLPCLVHGTPAVRAAAAWAVSRL
jgi:epoxyqueuosine reductase